MRKYIDETDKKNEVRMLFRHPSYAGKVILIVEGGSDVRLFRKLISHRDIKIESVDGKSRLHDVMKELVKEFPSRILGICDADHEHLTAESGRWNEISVLVTDFHDAEMMMISSPALRAFIDEYTKEEYLETLRSSLLDSALQAAYVIGAVRWANQVHHMNINFKGLNYGEFLRPNADRVEVDFGALIRILVNRSASLAEGLDVNKVQELTSHHQEKGACALQVCCGHDVTNIIAIIYRQNHVSHLANMDFKRVETSLRLAYGVAEFKSTGLFRNLVNLLIKCGIKDEICSVAPVSQ